MDESRGSNDLWWVAPKERAELLLGLGHHEPINDDHQPSPMPSSSTEPKIPGWYHSLTDEGTWSDDFRWYPPEFVAEWLAKCQFRNAYRTLRLIAESDTRTTLIGPLLIDIDNQQWKQGYVEDLADARNVACQAVTVLMEDYGLTPEKSFRLFFSGRKGFNIEIVPAALGIEGSEADQIKKSALALEDIVSKLSLDDTVIDRIYGNRFAYQIKHPYIRLHDSMNCWTSSSDIICRRRLALTVDDLRNLRVDQILERATAP